VTRPEGWRTDADEVFGTEKPTLRSLPRRSPLTVRKTETPPPKRRPPIKPRATFFEISRRALKWITLLTVLFVTMAFKRLRGKSTPGEWGYHLRRLFERMGGAAVKIGQQLSVRIDLFPYDVCRELELLVDSVPPFPTEQAVDIIERELGAKRGIPRVPLSEVFDALDPSPIGSASIACVYQGVLTNGELVAVKVLRPGIKRSIASDLGTIDFMTKVLEAFTIFRYGFFKNLRSELRTMLSEELDFAAEARYTRLFRYYARKDKVKFVTAPKVYTRLCTQRVLVTEFASGFWCGEVLAALENNDEDALTALAEKGITPKKLGKRLMQYSFWSRYEALFFHADPHHGNIIVREGCKLVFIDFGSCGTTSRKSRMNQLILMDRMNHNDVSGTVEAAVATLEPLPMLDVYSLKKALEIEFWNWLFAFRDKKAEWWERTTAGLWLVLLEETRKRSIPIGLETLRLARSLLLIDTLCFRLYPKMVSTDEFQVWERKAARRGMRRIRRRNEHVPWSHYVNTVANEADDFLSRFRYMAWLGERIFDRFPNQFADTLTKWSLFASEALRLGGLFVVGSVSIFFYVKYTERYQGQEWHGVREIIRGVLSRPIELGLLTLFLFIVYRRLSVRFHDVDIDRRNR
jgi:predicted unusual protein kinase regulating ubiquinone biosynthesis (AarF/ABC1/UbiB family)